MRTVLLATVFLASAGVAVAEPVQVAALPALLPPPVEAVESASGPAMVAVPVLKQSVQKGETITADNIVMQEIPASQAFVSTIKDATELAGQQAVRPLNAGSAINKLHVRVAPLVSRSQAVTFVYRKGGIELSGRGQALEDGQKGQSIRIANPATRSTVIGTVMADGSVELN